MRVNTNAGLTVSIHDTFRDLCGRVSQPIRLSDTAVKFCCPCHDDSSPSATARISDSGQRILAGCFACNAKGPEIATALGLPISALFGDVRPSHSTRESGKGFPDAAAAIRSYCGKLGEPSRTWDYHDANGRHIATQCRFDTPTGKEFRPVSLNCNGWIKKGPAEPRPLYGLPDLLAADTMSVYVCEGEKAADALRSIGLVAVTSMNGAKSPAKSDWKPMRGRTVTIWRDNDAPGVGYAQAVRGILRTIECDVRIIVTGSPDSGDDAYDWLEARGDAADPETLKAEIAAIPIEHLSEPEAKQERKGEGLIRNFDIVKSDPAAGEEKDIEIPVPIAEITITVNRLTDGWPRRVGGSLFVPEKDGEVSWLMNADSVFAYLGDKTGCPPRFISKSGFHTKSEFNEHLKRVSQEYLGVETLPHVPPLDRHYYTRSTPEPGDGAALDDLVDRFSVESDIDRELLLAAFVTPFWGGRGGTRPAFCLTAEGGRGSGKSKMASFIADVAGGFMDISANEEFQQIKTRLLSAEGLRRRVLLIDNVKSFKLSWAELEGLITSPVISGKRNYVGEGQRPNTLTVLLTLNGPSLSTDIAQRIVMIKLARPQFSPTWAEDTQRFIDANRQQIVADIVGFFQRPQHRLERCSRWGDWEHDILSRLADPEGAQAAIQERQEVADVEREEADIIEDCIKQRLEGLGYDTLAEHVFIPNEIFGQWYSEAVGERVSATKVTRSMKQRIDEGQIRRLTVSARAYGRGFEWWGQNASGCSEVLRDVGYRIEIQQTRSY